jgi:hypothetical protein
MSISELFYYFALGVFIFLTFGIIKNYYRNKFDENDRRKE